MKSNLPFPPPATNSPPTFTGVSVLPETIFACAFGAGQWNPADWRMAESPRWDRVNSWEQETDHIRNQGPETVAGETYTSMVCQQPLDGDFVVRSTMSFDDRMAPLLVVGQAPVPRPGGRWEYREHLELVLFDEGLNLWHHTYADGAPAWTLAANWRFPVEAGRRYALALACGSFECSVTLDGADIGSHAVRLERPLVAGITACEGVNRFYDFGLDRLLGPAITLSQ